jgi:hypothetical protein
MRPFMPTHEELQAVIGRAIVDPTFCKDLLNGHRQERLAEFELSLEEREIASSVQATDLATFAAAIDRWIESKPVTEVRNNPVVSMAWPWAFASAS